jgi:hypothetical protein
MTLYKLLLHFDGPDGASKDVDVAEYKDFATANGTGVLTDDEKKFGVTSLLLPDSGADFASLLPQASYIIGTDEFTLDFWLKTADAHSSVSVICESAHHQWVFTVGHEDTPGTKIEVSFTATHIDPVASVADLEYSEVGDTFEADWVHIMLCRSTTFVAGTPGAGLGLYINGTLVAWTTVTTDLDHEEALGLGEDQTIRIATNLAHACYIDELRLVVGTALEIGATYTPPTEAYTITETVQTPTINYVVDPTTEKV